MEKEKVVILAQYRSMIIESWTFQRLTEEEKERLMIFLSPENPQIREALKGRRGHCWDILQAVYSSFLQALGYKPIGWREPEKGDL